MPVSVQHSHPKGHASAFVDQAPLGLQPHGPGGDGASPLVRHPLSVASSPLDPARARLSGDLEHVGGGTRPLVHVVDDGGRVLRRDGRGAQGGATSCGARRTTRPAAQEPDAVLPETWRTGSVSWPVSRNRWHVG